MLILIFFNGKKWTIIYRYYLLLAFNGSVAMPVDSLGVSQLNLLFAYSKHKSADQLCYPKGYQYLNLLTSGWFEADLVGNPEDRVFFRRGLT